MFSIAGITEEPSKNIFQLVIQRNREEREYEEKVCKEQSFFQNQDLTIQYWMWINNLVEPWIRTSVYVRGKEMNGKVQDEIQIS